MSGKYETSEETPGIATSRKLSMLSQLKKMNTVGSPDEGDLHLSYHLSYVQELKSVFLEIPGDVLLIVSFPLLAYLYSASQRVTFLMSGLGVSFVTFGLNAACIFPLKYNLLCQFHFVIAGLILWHLYRPGVNGNHFFQLSDDLLENYIFNILPFGAACAIESFLFNFLSFSFHKRLDLSGVVGVALWCALTNFLMAIGVSLFQWFMFSSDLTASEELLWVGFLYPLFGATVGRVLFSDQLTFFHCRFCLNKQDSGWDSSEALQIRVYWITLTRFILGFPGSLSVVNVENNNTFVLSFVTSNIIEIVFGLGWFFLSYKVIPSCRFVSQARMKSVKISPDTASDPENTLAGKCTMKNNGEAKISFTQALRIWMNSFSEREKIPARFAINRAYEERIERLLLLGVTATLLVTGSKSIDPLTVLFRGIGAYLTEILLVDPIKTFIQLRILDIRPMRRTHGFHVYASFITVQAASIALLFITRAYFTDYGLPITF